MPRADRSSARGAEGVSAILAVIGVFVIVWLLAWHDHRIDKHVRDMFRDDGD